MPLYDVGYRRWEGEEKGWLYRMLAITKAGIGIVLRSLWVKISIVIGWLLAVIVGGFFFSFEYAHSTRPEMLKKEFQSYLEEIPNELRGAEFEKKWQEVGRQQKKKIVQEYLNRNEGMVAFFGGPGAEELAETILFGDRKDFRRIVWARLLLMFFRMPQGMTLLIIIGWIAPPLISKDIRTRAFLLYFSRPLYRLSYIGGKLLILVGISSALATIPALALYAFGVGLSPDTGVIWETWDLPCKIIFASMIHIIPSSILALTLSSLTSESRYAMFSWYAIWGLGFLTWTIISMAGYDGDMSRYYEAQASGDPFFLFQSCSIYHVIADSQSAAMGLENGTLISYGCMVFTFAMSALCFLILWYRIGRVTNQ